MHVLNETLRHVVVEEAAEVLIKLQRGTMPDDEATVILSGLAQRYEAAIEPLQAFETPAET